MAGNTAAPVLSLLRPAWPPGAAEQEHRELSPAAGWAKRRAGGGNTRPGSSFLPLPPPPPGPTHGSGARRRDGWSAWVGVTLGTLAAATGLARNDPWASRWRRRAAEARPAGGPEAPERVDTPRPGSPGQCPETGVLHARGPDDTPGPVCPCLRAGAPVHNHPRGGMGCWVSAATPVAQRRGETCKARGRWGGQSPQPLPWVGPGAPGRGGGRRGPAPLPTPR